MGCSDSVLYNVKITEPDIIVYPEKIDFGNLLSGEESKSESILIINAGDEILHIDSPFLHDPTGRYAMGFESEYALEPGELVDVPISYTPVTYEENEAYVEILSDDDDENTITVSIIGRGDAPVIEVTPTEFDYGDISIGCDNEESITIGNVGNLPLEVSNVTQMVTQPVDILLEYGSLPEPPWVIDPGNELDFLVSYVPTDVGEDLSDILIESNDPLTPEVTTGQVGNGDVEQWVMDEFEQEEVPLIDIMWVVDDSGSMNTFQTHMITNMQLFMNTFLASSPDYHMGFISSTTSTWELGMYIDDSFSDPAISAMSIISSIGTVGSAYETGIQQSVNALMDPSVAGPGSDFLRDDAHLIIIYVSDEPDYSSDTLANYITFFNHVKPASQLSIYAVIGDYPAGCQYYLGAYPRTAQFGAGYYNLALEFPGGWYSICAADWGSQMQDLADSVTVVRTFKLSEADPIEETIKVYVNGQESIEGWLYDSSDNAVVFEPDIIPHVGHTIEIEYATWGCG